MGQCIPPPRQVLPVLRYQSAIWHVVRDRHKKLIICSLAHRQPSLQLLRKSVLKFLRKVANRQTDRQPGTQRWKHNLLGGGNKIRLPDVEPIRIGELVVQPVWQQVMSCKRSLTVQLHLKSVDSDCNVACTRRYLQTRTGELAARFRVKIFVGPCMKWPQTTSDRWQRFIRVDWKCGTRRISIVRCLLIEALEMES